MFNWKIVRSNRVCYTRANGKNYRMQLTAISGDYNGSLNFRMVKAVKPKDARDKVKNALGERARKVTFIDNGTFKKDYLYNDGLCKILFKTKREGFGIKASPDITSMLEIAGYRNGLVKSYSKVATHKLLGSIFNMVTDKKWEDEDSY